jgi:hypothetical protein
MTIKLLAAGAAAAALFAVGPAFAGGDHAKHQDADKTAATSSTATETASPAASAPEQGAAASTTATDAAAAPAKEEAPAAPAKEETDAKKDDAKQ